MSTHHGILSRSCRELMPSLRDSVLSIASYLGLASEAITWRRSATDLGTRESQSDDIRQPSCGITPPLSLTPEPCEAPTTDRLITDRRFDFDRQNSFYQAELGLLPRNRCLEIFA